MGLMNRAAARQLMSTPDREGAEALLAEARARGMSTQGVDLVLIPYKDGGNVAAVVFDGGSGFSFGQGGALANVGRAFSQIAGGPTADRLDIKYVTAVYVSPKGQQLMALSASRADSLTFANGGMSEEQFMAKLNGDINLPAVINEQIDSLQQLAQ